MDAVQQTLRRLRGWFVAWFVAESVVGTVIAAYVIEGLKHDPFLHGALRGVGADFVVLSGFVGSALVLALGLLVMAALVALRPWARVVMLVVGWLSVLGALFSLAAAPGAQAIAARFGGDTWLEWQTMRAADLMTKGGDVLFRGLGHRHAAVQRNGAAGVRAGVGRTAALEAQVSPLSASPPGPDAARGPVRRSGGHRRSGAHAAALRRRGQPPGWPEPSLRRGGQPPGWPEPSLGRSGQPPGWPSTE